MRLSHVTLFVTDLPRSRAFYLALGFPLIVDESHYCRFLARVGEAQGDETLSIEQRAAPFTSGAQLGLEFPSRDALDSYVVQLSERGVALREQLQDRPWLWRDARVVDPDGHELMLFFAGSNKLEPPWRVRE